jgi:flavin reductase (DIM6/NTAB) family NADH-FMN oxidoreductase RutF
MKIVPGDLSRRDAHELMMSAVLPRPIAFISTISEDGVLNLAPFSCFAPLGSKPALVCIHISLKRDGRKKDTVRNIEYSRDFVVNAVTEGLAEAMNSTAGDYPPEVDEFKEAGLTPVPAELVRAPRVAESPVSMECRLQTMMEFGQAPAAGHVIIGEIILMHVRDDLWTGEDIDVRGLKPIGRIGGQLYCRMTDIFEIPRPSTLGLD